MATVYLDPVLGDDSRTYAQAQDSATPWATISKGIGSSNTGDTIILLDGTYTSIGGPFAVTSRTLRAANRGAAIITAAFNSSTLPIYLYWFSCTNTYTLTLSGLKFLNCTGANAVSLVQGVYGGQIIVENCIFENLDASGNTGGLYLAMSSNVIFRNNLVNGFKEGANERLFRCDSGTLDIYNCTLYTASLAANMYFLGNNAGTITVKNCIVQNAASPQSVIWKSGSGTINVGADTCLRNISSPPAGVLRSDPKFIDPASGRFRLRQDSPLLNAGVNL